MSRRAQRRPSSTPRPRDLPPLAAGRASASRRLLGANRPDRGVSVPGRWSSTPLEWCRRCALNLQQPSARRWPPLNPRQTSPVHRRPGELRPFTSAEPVFGRLEESCSTGPAEESRSDASFPAESTKERSPETWRDCDRLSCTGRCLADLSRLRSRRCRTTRPRDCRGRGTSRGC